MMGITTTFDSGKRSWLGRHLCPKLWRPLCDRGYTMRIYSGQDDDRGLDTMIWVSFVYIPSPLNDSKLTDLLLTIPSPRGQSVLCLRLERDVDQIAVVWWVILKNGRRFSKQR